MASTKSGTAAAAPSPRTARKPRSATPSSSAAAEKSPTAKSLPKAAPQKNVKENIPLGSAQKSPSSRTPTKSVVISDNSTPKSSQPSQSKKHTRSGTPIARGATPGDSPQVPERATPKRAAATPDKTPDAADATPGSRHSSRKRTQTPRAAESWALNSITKKNQNKRTSEENVTTYATSSMQQEVEVVDSPKQKGKSKNTYITNKEAEAIIDRYINGLKSETQSEEEDEEKAIRDYQHKKQNNKEGVLFWPTDLEDPDTLEMDEEGLKMQKIAGEARKTLKRPTKSRASLARESPEKSKEKNNEDAEESESILYEIKSTPESVRRKRKAKGKGKEKLRTLEEESDDDIVHTDISPSKKPRNKKVETDKKAEEAQKKITDSLSRMSVEQSQEEDADEEDVVEKKKETHAEMLKRLEKTRAKKTYGGKKKKNISPASLANIINARVNLARKTNPKPPRPANQSDADDSDATIPPVSSKPSSSQPQPRRASRLTSLKAEASTADSHGRTRSSASPHVQTAHLDSSGTNLEYIACPYFYAMVNQGIIAYPEAYDEKANKPWPLLKPSRIRITEFGKSKLISGLETVWIDRGKLKIHPSQIIDKDEWQFESLPDTKRRKSSLAKDKEGEEEKLDLQPAKILDARRDEAGKRYMLVAWYWDRPAIKNDLKGFPGYLNRRWPVGKKWEWMICAELDVVCEESIHSRIPNVVCEDDKVYSVNGQPGKRDERFCTSMVYGGEGLNYEIFGRDVGKPGYNLDGVELNEEDRKTFKQGEDKKPKKERKKRAEVEEKLRFWFDQFWKTREYMDRHRCETVTVDGVEEETWGDSGDDYGRAYISLEKGGTGRLLPKRMGGLLSDTEDDDGMTDEKTGDEEEGEEGAMDIDA